MSTRARLRRPVGRGRQEAEVELPAGKLGVQVQSGNPADALRSMALFDRGLDTAAAQATALDQVRLFGGSLPPLLGTRKGAEAIPALFERAAGGRGRYGGDESRSAPRFGCC